MTARVLFISFFLVIAAVGIADPGATLQEAKAKAQAVIRFSSHLGEVEFHHKQHFDDHGVECATCHHETNAHKLEFSHKNLIPTYRVDCQICHHEGKAPLTPQSCSKCHHPTPSSTADETASSKVALHKDCWKCHEIGKGAEASANCKFCHTGAQKAW